MNSALSARCRFIGISIDWMLVAALEALAYSALAWAIAQKQSPLYVLLFAGLAIVITVLVTRAGFFTGIRLAGDLYAAISHALSKAKVSWFNDEKRSLVSNVASRGIPTLMSVPAHALQSFIHAPLIPCFLLISIAWFSNLTNMLIAAGLLIASFVLQFYAQRALSRNDAKRHASELKAGQSTLELVDHLELLRTAAGANKAIDRLEQSWQNQEAALAKTNTAAAFSTLISSLASVLPVAGMLAFWAVTGFADTAVLLALVILLLRAAAPLDGLALAGLSINDLRSTIADYQQILTAPTLSEPVTSQAISGYHFSLQQVSYAPAIEQLNSEITQGSRLVISGVSGAGKSTLLSLLMRFDDPQTGQICLGDTPLSALRHADLTQHIAYVAQDPIIFTGTLAENIGQGRAQASEQDIRQVAEAMQLSEVIQRSNLGLGQSVGHQGSALSGGEQQRVALARALLKKAPILILDEATSALDEATERLIAQHIQQLNVTLIIVTHRDPSVWQPTHYLSLPEGKITTHTPSTYCSL